MRGLVVRFSLTASRTTTERQTNNAMKLKHKRILITGGTSGIGYQLTRQLCVDNTVIVIARDEARLAAQASVITYRADLAEPSDVEAVAERIVTRFGRIDLLINNAAIQNTPSFLDETFQYSSIAREIAVNFTSVCNLTYLLLPVLLQDKPAVIMNINSGLALAPKTSSAVYCATKAALDVFSQSLRYQLEQSNIWVQQVFFELVDTAMTEGRGSKKMSAKQAACEVITVLQKEVQDHDVGKVKLLCCLLRFAPCVAKKIMKAY